MDCACMVPNRMMQEKNVGSVPMADEIGIPIDVIRRDHGTSYVIDILGRINLPVVPVCEGLKGMDGIAHARMRHDVDHHLPTALAMAHLEQNLGIAATYYMLPPDGVIRTSNYFGEIIDGRLHISRLFLDVAKRMQDMGHEIGIHNDFISFWIGTGIPPADAIADILDTMSAAGLRVRGMAAHGSMLCYKHRYLNGEIFQGVRGWCESDTLDIGGRKLALRILRREDFGLEYADGHAGSSLHISDSRNNLCLDFQGRSLPLDGEALAGNVIMEHVGKIPDFSSIQLLIHPEHWWIKVAGKEDGEACADLMLENMLAARMDAKRFIVEHYSNVICADMGDPAASYNIQYNRNVRHFPDQGNWLSFPLAAMEGVDTEPHILELGCGQGDFLSMVARALPENPERVCVGVDASFAGIADAAAKHPRCRWVVDRCERFLEGILDGAEIFQELPRRYGLILDKTGMTAVNDLETAYGALKRISRLLAPGGRYVYLAHPSFYARCYADKERWPLGWIDIAIKIFSSARRLSDPAGRLAYSFGMDG